VGFSPYYTAAIWFGFDKPGNSLGVEQTGATIAAPIWADYMRDIHKGLEYKDFPSPQSGVSNVSVCAVSGLLPTEFCDEGKVNLLYLDGTQPVKSCDLHKDKSQETRELLDKITGTPSPGIGDTTLIQPDSTLIIPDLDATITTDLPPL